MTATPATRAVLLSARPNGQVRESDFSIVDVAAPLPGPGQLLVETRFLSLDPGLRNLLGTDEGYIPPIRVGDMLSTTLLGRVLTSHHAGFAEGDMVVGNGTASSLSVVTPGPMCWKVDPADLPSPSHALGLQGATGLTAYFGMLDVGRPVAGETVLVSGAAGAVGSVAGQIARLQGCRVVGLAGGAVKTRRLVDEFGFDAAIDYQGLSAEALEQAIAAACPGGVDIFFDNVGGAQLDAALAHMNWAGRVVACGQISGYDGQAAPTMRNLFRIIGRTLRVEGFLVFTFADRFPAAIAQLGRWNREGMVKAREEIVDGIDQAPAAFLRLFAGRNQGKLIVRL